LREWLKNVKNKKKMVPLNNAFGALVKYVKKGNKK
jgi:hypothetical protein